MRKLVKIFLILVVIVVVLFAIAGVLLVKIVNPNNFKQQVSHVVYKNTGRTLSMNGNMSWSFFPWLGLRLENVTLSNPADFPQDQPFAKIGEADVSIKILPLLHKKIDMGAVVLKDTNINLIRNKEGKTNWEMSNKEEAASTQQPAKPSTARNHHNYSINISSIQILNANINWLDEKTGKNIAIKDVEFMSGNIGFDKFFPIKLAFILQAKQPKLGAEISLTSKVNLDSEKGIFQLQNLELNTLVTNYSLTSNNQMNASLKGNASLNLNNNTLAINNLTLNSDDVQASAQAQGKNLSTNPAIQGEIQITSLNLKMLLREFGINLFTQDPSVLQKINLTTQFAATGNSLQLNQLKASIDETDLGGSLNITDFKTYSGNFQLSMDKLNLDRYLTAANSTVVKKNTVSNNKGSSSSTSPLAVLNKASINGSLQIGNLTIAKTSIQNINALIKGTQGIIKISPLLANIYGGKANAQVTVDIRNAIPRYTVNGDLTNIQISQLLKMGKVSGAANISGNIVTQGQDVNSLLANLNGTTKFSITNGILHGVDIIGQLNRAYALITKRPVTQPVGNQTDFGQLTGTGIFRNGVFSNNDLVIDSSSLHVNGQGSVNLVTQAVNYHLNAAAKHTTTNAQGQKIQVPHKTAIPLIVTGTLSQPSVGPDTVAIGRLIVKEQLNKILDGSKDTGKNIGDALQKTLKGLLH